MGPGFEPTPVTIHVTSNLAVMKEKGTGNPVHELYLFGLAGTTITRTLTFESALGYPVSEVKVSPNWKPLTPRDPNTRDYLTLLPKSHLKGPEVTLTVTVPHSVHEGWYSSEMTFQVKPEDKGGDAPALQVSLPIYLQVSHVGVTFRSDGKVVKGPLRLPLPAAGQGQVSAALTLHTDAEKAAVRWGVEQIKPGGGTGQSLDPGDGRLAVLFNGVNVLPPRKGPSDPITQKPVPVTIRVTPNGLAPGLYRTALRFHSYEDLPGEPGGKDPQGLTNDLELELLVPGRQVTAEVVPAARPQLGQECAVQVTVVCYACAPGKGELRVVDKAGHPLEPSRVIGGPPVKTEQDPNLPERSWHMYLVKVPLKRAGKNRFQINWPGLIPQDVNHAPVELDALGVIEVKPGVPRQDVLRLEEEVVIRATVDPAQVGPAGRVVLHAINDRDADKQPLTIELTADDRAGDGVYSGRFTFKHLGKFTISPAAGLTVTPVTVQVGFEFDCPHNVGTFEYGGGAIQELFQIPQELSAPGVIKLTNKLPVTCRWRADPLPDGVRGFLANL